MPLPPARKRASTSPRAGTARFSAPCGEAGFFYPAAQGPARAGKSEGKRGPALPGKRRTAGQGTGKAPYMARSSSSPCPLHPCRERTLREGKGPYRMCCDIAPCTAKETARLTVPPFPALSMPATSPGALSHARGQGRKRPGEGQEDGRPLLFTGVMARPLLDLWFRRLRARKEFPQQQGASCGKTQARALLLRSLFA